jgi:hypothetical protein
MSALDCPDPASVHGKAGRSWSDVIAEIERLAPSDRIDKTAHATCEVAP